ncbi:MAG: indole-3-glycerol phosphate synthase TrpC, partial [Caulobacterales bacterium]
AEVKKASPSRGLIRADFDPAAIAAAYEEGGAACLSVLTDGPSFQGDDSYLQMARAACSLPCLRKDFTIDPYQIAEARMLGADAVLVILAAVEDSVAGELMASAESYGLDMLVEVHNVAELDRAAKLQAKFIGINNRSLRSFETSLEVTETRAGFAPKDAFLVSESGIFTSEDVARVRRCGARAVLVGESLMRQDDVAAATRTLLAPCG